jgi:hypothetical protein
MTRRAFAILLFACVAAALFTGISGGLVRVGVAWPLSVQADWAARAALDHAAFMICAFMGTMIALERAVALKEAWAWMAPVLSAIAGLLLAVAGHGAAGWLLAAAALVFVAANAAIVAKQRAGHTVLLLAGSMCWLAGNVLFAAGLGAREIEPWWFAFLVMTVAAERLEMTRLTRRTPAASGSLYAIMALLLIGCAAAASAPSFACILYGTSLLLLAAWFVRYDIARRTVHAAGLTRYMAACLLGGYAWLAISGLAWIATALGAPARDTAIHALGLGFLLSMVLGHAPVILPAVARVKVLFGGWFYAPLVLLHASLALRLAGGAFDFTWKRSGAETNALTIALFALVVLGSALAWRLRHGERRARRT